MSHGKLTCNTACGHPRRPSGGQAEARDVDCPTLVWLYLPQLPCRGRSPGTWSYLEEGRETTGRRACANNPTHSDLRIEVRLL